jgi:hypothetical protein
MTRQTRQERMQIEKRTGQAGKAELNAGGQTPGQADGAGGNIRQRIGREDRKGIRAG